MTEKQREALLQIRTGRVEMVNAGSAAYRIEGASPPVVGRLVSMGLAIWPKGPVGVQACQITEAGRAALASH